MSLILHQGEKPVFQMLFLQSPNLFPVQFNSSLTKEENLQTVNSFNLLLQLDL